MAAREVWNFVHKFNNLLNTGKNATLSLKSQNGKISINLQLDLHADIIPQKLTPHHKRPSPSRIRRTERRARACDDAAAAESAAPAASSGVQAVLLQSSKKNTAEQAVFIPQESHEVALQAENTPNETKDTSDAAVQVACAATALQASPEDHYEQPHPHQGRNDHVIHQLQNLYEEVEKAHADFNEMKKLKNEEIQILKNQLQSLPALILSQLQSQLQQNTT